MLRRYGTDREHLVPTRVRSASSISTTRHPCLYRRGDRPTVERSVRVRTTDTAGWTVYSDALTAQSFACDAPPPDAAQRLKRTGN
jgi:hypothetical protein